MSYTLECPSVIPGKCSRNVKLVKLRVYPEPWIARPPRPGNNKQQSHLQSHSIYSPLSRARLFRYLPGWNGHCRYSKTADRNHK